MKKRLEVLMTMVWGLDAYFIFTILMHGQNPKLYPWLTSLSALYLIYLILRLARALPKPSQKIWPLSRLAILVLLVFGTIYASLNGALARQIDHWQNQKSFTVENHHFEQTTLQSLFEKAQATMKMGEDLYILDEPYFDIGSDGTFNDFIVHVQSSSHKKAYLMYYDNYKNKVIVEKTTYQERDFDMYASYQAFLGMMEESSIKPWLFGRYGSCHITYTPYKEVLTTSNVMVLDQDSVPNGVYVSGNVVNIENGSMTYVTNSQILSDQQVQHNQMIDLQDGLSIQDDGAYYRFNNTIYRFHIVDAALGTYYYELQESTDEGFTFTTINEDPFDGQGGHINEMVMDESGYGLVTLNQGGDEANSLWLLSIQDKQLQSLSLDVPSGYDYVGALTMHSGTMYVSIGQDSSLDNRIDFASYDHGETWIKQ